MKTKDILEWICRESVNGENLNCVDIPEEEWQTEEWWINMFGNCPPAPIAEGRYLYYYLVSVGDSIEVDGRLIEPDAEIELSDPDSMFGVDYVYLYKLDD